MEVNINVPEPAPPVNFDVKGLTEDEVIKLRDLLGHLAYDGDDGLAQLYNKLSEATPHVAGARYTFKTDGKPLYTIHATHRDSWY